MKNIMLLVLFLGLWHSFASLANANVSLQEQINQTPPNGVIHLKNKMYSGNIVIKKPLSIIGSRHSIIRGDGKGNVITIKSSGVKLEGFRIQHSSITRNTIEEYAAVLVDHAEGNLLKNLTISDSFHGIYLNYANQNRVEQITVTGQGKKEIGGQGNGINLNHSNRNTLISNQIKETRDGIYFYKSDGNVVKQNLVEKTRFGLHYMYADNNQFSGNRFTRNDGGAAIMISRHMELKNNEFSFHEGSKAFGILLLESEDVVISDNRFFHNVSGLYIDNSFNNKISHNRFSLNQVGVEVLSSSNHQVFTKNHFFNNTAPVITDSVRADNIWSEKGKGNDWGYSFPLIDLNQDGVGDLPVTYKSSLFKLLNDNELAYLFMKSPAIGLYEKLGELTNVQEMMFEDAHPLLPERPKISLFWPMLSVIVLIPGYWVFRRRRFV